MCGWIRGVGCTLWQPIDVHSAELRLPARAPQHILCQGHCAVSGSGRGPCGRYGSKLGTQFKPREFDNVPHWTACFESIKKFFFFIIMMKFKGSCLYSWTKQICTLVSLECVCHVPKNIIYDGTNPNTVSLYLFLWFLIFRFFSHNRTVWNHLLSTIIYHLKDLCTHQWHTISQDHDLGLFRLLY